MQDGATDKGMPVEGVGPLRSRGAKREPVSYGPASHTDARSNPGGPPREWERVFDAANDVVFLTDRQFRITWANRATSQVLGKPLDKIVGKTCSQAIHGTGRPPKNCPLVQAHRTKRHAEGEVCVSERRVWLGVSADPVLDEKGDVTGVLHIAKDITGPKKMKEATHEREEKYKNLFENAREAILLIDLRGNITAVNRRVEDYGFKREKLIGQKLFDFVVEDYRARARADFQVLLGGKPVKGQMDVITPKGVVSVEYRDNPIRRGGQVVGVQAILTDVTKRKRAEQLLREERDTVQRYLDIAGVMLMVIDCEQRVGLINRRGCEVLGYAEEEVLGKNWFDHFLPDSVRNEARAAFQGILHGERRSFERYSTAVLTHTGEERQVNWHNTVLRDDRGEAVAILSSGEDVTEQRRAEEALRLSEERYRGIFENAVLGMYQTTPEGEILAANPALVRMLGYDTLAELAARDLEEDGFEREHPRSLFKERMEANDQIVGLESAWKRRDGSTLWVRESARAVRDEAGRTLFYEGTVEDITERKRADQLMRTLATTAMELVELPVEADLFQFIGEKVLVLIGTGIVSVNSIEGDTLTVRQIAGATTVALKLAQRLLGRTILGMPLKGVHEVARNDLLTGKLKKVEGGLYELFFRTVPRPVCWTLEKGLGIQECHSIGIRRPGTLLGNVTILTQKGTELNAGVIEAFVNQASIAWERRNVIETLLRSEEQYRRMVTTAAEGIFVLDRNHRFVFANDRLAALLGYTPQEVLDKPAESVVFPPELADHARQVSDRRQGKKGAYERRLVRKDGGVIWSWVSAAPILDANGEFEGSLGMVTDITERKKAEQELRETMRLNQILLDAMPCVALLLRAGTREVVASNEAARAVNAIPGTTCFRAWAQRSTPCPWCLAPEVWATEQARHLVVEYEGVVWDAHWLPVAGDLYMHYAFDITERKRVEEEVRQQLEELRRWHDVTIRREERIAELKREVNTLAARLGEPPPYQSVEEPCPGEGR